jgi:hypothetical protein
VTATAPWTPVGGDASSPAAPPPGPSWRVRRGPVAIAVTIIVVVAVAGWGLRQWGYFNPAVSVTSHVETTQGAAPPVAYLTVANESGSAVDITAVSVLPVSSRGGQAPKVAAVEGFTWVPLGPDSARQGPTHALPVHVPAHAQSELQVTFVEPFCGSIPLVASSDNSLAVRVRTASGRTKTLVAVGPLPTISCTNQLLRGHQAADPAARAAVISAFSIVYDPSRPAAARLALIDDPTGVTRASQAVFAGRYGVAAHHESVRVTDVELDRRDHAWVRFDLYTGVATNPVLRGRLGEARLVHGTWKVTRATVCADLALAGATCS